MIVFLAIFSIAAVIFVKERLYPDETEAAHSTLDRFYEAFMANDIGSASEYIEERNGQLVINYRFYYGKIKAYEITDFNPRDDLHIEAKVQVTIEEPVDGRSVFTDTLQLEKIRRNWLITRYESTSQQYLWPELP